MTSTPSPLPHSALSPALSTRQSWSEHANQVVLDHADGRPRWAGLLSFCLLWERGARERSHWTAVAAKAPDTLTLSARPTSSFAESPGYAVRAACCLMVRCFSTGSWHCWVPMPTYDNPQGWGLARA
eukprot:CAMPEP_0206455334 /NCGR_PEP_ID=MMETSP0324_2-20121206/21686_1 /ASSEMBLY_ACC=CAM_ASM_000836 /TAXON_ID=2866 /ORGANISM="Crypthecodinium cohnii, Strain Seligo" /LENGTH=126 /DNA_ID=CAMNT_0053926009 /DNA_START=163 /DNA_END=540 /DNA_ORIENTATION=+